ncbi:MAG: hypothetical protein IJH91_07605 [Mogibacterium sp.]|nr:hypothetical protein [Mogibacterium sp.]
MSSISVISVAVLSAALLLAMVLNLALKPSFSAKLTTGCMLISLVGGLLIYGTGFAEVTGNIPLSIIRTLFCVFKMFVGINDYASIAASSFVSTMTGLICFWILHLLAFYSMASAVMFTLGAEALRYLRLLLSRRGDLTLIYGINENSIAVGRECVRQGGNAVVFIAENADSALIGDLNNQGMSVVTGSEAVNSDPKVLRRLHADRRKLTVYALGEDADEDLFYALKLKSGLSELNVPPENTRLTLPGAEDIITSMLQVSKDGYGFGYVHVYDESELSARALIRTCPPWDFIHFDENGRATEDFECVVVGFGSHGQAALKQLVMNGQFEGSHFRAAVFSPRFPEESGYIYAVSPEMLKQYDIKSFTASGGSREFYDYVAKRIKTLKMIVVCTGNEVTNREISNSLMLYLKRRNAEHICVIQCGKNGVRYQETVGSPIIRTDIYTLDLLSAERADRAAILLNAMYDTSDRSNWDKWVACDTFSKMSSRCSADFSPAFLKASGISREQMTAGEWNPSPEMLEVLGKTEHLRWNAFHFVMGYSTMPQEVFEANAAEWKRRKEQGLPCDIRITKDTIARTHACLIPWDALDELSAREHEVTGRVIDYKQVDINNVLALPELLRAEKGATN